MTNGTLYPSSNLNNTMGKPKNQGIKKVLVISDTHIGSTKGLLNPGFKTLEGNEIKLNAMQEWLWMCWIRANEFVADVTNGEPYALVINGDVIEGVHHQTKEIWSPLIQDQVEASLQILAPLSEAAAKTFVIRGTECHVGNTEEVVGKVLNAEKDHQTGNNSFDRLTLDLNGIRHVFRHHIGTSVRRGLAGTQLSANLVEEQVEAVNNGEPIPRVVCCAHRHKFGTYTDGNGLCVVSPPWQGLTRFGHKVVSQARSQPGLYILDYENKQMGQLPEVISKCYTAPHPQAIQLD